MRLWTPLFRRFSPGLPAGISKWILIWKFAGGAASLIQTPVGMLAHQDAFPLPNRIRGSECARKNRPASFEMTEWRGGPISENQILRGMRAALGGGLNEVDEVAAGVFEEDGDDGTHARWFAAEAYAELLEAAVFGGDVVG